LFTLQSIANQVSMSGSFVVPTTMNCSYAPIIACTTRKNPLKKLDGKSEHIYS
jgi:hypothetical protein